MCQLNQISQKNAVISENLAQTAENMNHQASSLQALMHFFKVKQQVICNE
jgi:methyl-accepting chemotaxis protein